MHLDSELLLALPKVELHLHLDCSLSFEVVKKLRPHISELEYRQKFIAPEKCTNLADFLKCTISGIDLMQTEAELQQVVQDLFYQLKKEHVIYAEIRFAPLQHLKKGLMAEAVVEIVAESVKAASDLTGIKAGIILCTLRHYHEAQSLRTIKLVTRASKYTNLVGFDMAADEAGFPIDAHKAAFEYAFQQQIPRTAHAGEAKGAASVWETIHHFKPQRIGHGVRSIEDQKLIDFLAENQIHLEVCPTCNIQTDVFKAYHDHPIDRLYQAGVQVGINTDARALVNVSLTAEYARLADTFGWGMQHFYRCNLNALTAAFISKTDQAGLARRLESGYATYLKN